MFAPVEGVIDESNRDAEQRLFVLDAISPERLSEVVACVGFVFQFVTGNKKVSSYHPNIVESARNPSTRYMSWAIGIPNLPRPAMLHGKLEMQKNGLYLLPSDLNFSGVRFSVFTNDSEIQGGQRVVPAASHELMAEFDGALTERADTYFADVVVPIPSHFAGMYDPSRDYTAPRVQ